MAKKYTKSDCIALLRAKMQEISLHGEKRYPKRADFSSEEVNAIKAFLGAWGRALESAGIKPPSEKPKGENQS